MSLLDYTINATNEYVEKMPKVLRKKYGQFFTSKETAIFMAELFDIPTDKTELKVLDAGAGSGTLSVALLERLQSVSSLQQIYLVCYENDPNIIEVLRSNLDWVCQNSKIQITYELRIDN